MPQIGWSEILIIVVLAILVIGAERFSLYLGKLEVGLAQLKDILVTSKTKWQS